MTFAPDGRTLAVGRDRGVELLDADTGRKLGSMDGSGFSYDRLAYSTDGHRLVAASLSSIEAWDTTTGKEILSSRVGERDHNGLAISPDGRAFASAARGPTYCRRIGLFGMGGFACGSKGGWVRVWDGTTGGDQPRVFETRGTAHDVAFSPDGRTLASASWDGVKLWELAEGRGRKVLDEPVFALTYSPDGRTLAIGLGDSSDDIGEVRLWDVATRRARSVLRGYLGPIRSVAFARDARTLLVVSWKGVALWDLPVEPPVRLGGPVDPR